MKRHSKAKRFSALLLALLMVLTVIPAASFAEDTGTGAAATAENGLPVWPDEGSIKLGKDAEAIDGKDNLWEVTLDIQGKNYRTTSDVVLVIDCSGSMKGTKLTNTRKAAKAFGEKLLVKGSATRIAIVTYVDTATAYNNGHFYTADELDAFKTAVDNATYANGGTNQQAGIHKAQELLSQSTAGLKNIVILSDGEATYSYLFTATATYSDCKARTTSRCPRDGRITDISGVSPDYGSIIGDGQKFRMPFNYNTRVTATCPRHGRTVNSHYVYSLDGTYSTNSKTNNGVATIWEANQAKAAGTTIYSVALQAGTNGEATLKACASDAVKDYYAIGANDNVETKLTDAFTAIAGSIAIAAKNGAVADTMGDKVQLSFSGASPVITTDPAVYRAGNADVYISQGSATYDAAARCIHWTVGNVSEADKPVMKYKVTVRDGYNPQTGETLLTNEKATFTYVNYQDQTTVGEFPKPEVTVGGGKILVHYYLVNGSGEPINESGVVVESPALAKQVKAAEYFAVNGDTGLSYNTPYTVTKAEIDGNQYYGSYIVNNGALTAGDSAQITLTAANSNQHVWFAYTQEFTVVHVQNGRAVQTDTHAVAAGFDMTAQVPSGYLYGGTFSNEACTTVASFNGGNPTSFTPTAGATYYIWEVEDVYLSPKTLSIWEHVFENGTATTNVDVIGFYLVTAIDRMNYSEVGFMVGDQSLIANQGSDFLEDENYTKYSNLGDHTSVVYEKIRIPLKSGKWFDCKVEDFIDSNHSGYLGCYAMDKNTYWQAKDAAITFTPYWVTLDGVKVTSGHTRTNRYLGAGSDSAPNDLYKQFAKDKEDDVSAPKCEAVTVHSNAKLMLFDVFTADGSPVVPQPPTTPTEPETYTVTLHDHDEIRTIDHIAAGSDVTDQVAPIGASGMRFAGWFTDEACTVAADFSNVTANMDAYAKYVSNSYLSVKYTALGLFRTTRISLVSALDARDYKETGFVINGQTVPVTDYSTRYMYVANAQTLFGRSVARNAPLMTAEYALRNVKNGDSITVTPYWVTKDGTTVYGTPRTLTYRNGRVSG